VALVYKSSDFGCTPAKDFADSAESKRLQFSVAWRMEAVQFPQAAALKASHVTCTFPCSWASKSNIVQEGVRV
jgi:hypothetical protein